jgi:hypothetical protein
MLISKSNFGEGDLVSFKLANGDELVGHLAKVSDSEYTIERPTTVVPSQKGIMLIASLFTASPEMTITIRKDHVLFAAITAKEVKDYYIQTTTGIQPVSASVLTGAV